MKIFFSIIWFIVYLKLLLFWLWLWQLKEYHLGRFLAHFESQRARKVLFSFKGIKFPKLTPKIILILIVGILLGALGLNLFYNLSSAYYVAVFLLSLLLTPIFVSILILIFKIPTAIFVKIILLRAKRKIGTFKDLIIIGITGSYGKTSTKEFLAQILSEKFNVLKTEKHINAEMGVAKTILNKLKSEHQIFIVEMGAYERGKIKEVCSMVSPKIGILTGINQQHLSTFGSQENIVKAKFELIDSLSVNGVAIINGDNEFIKSQALNKKTISCSVKGKADMRAENILIDKEFVSFKAVSRDGDSADFKINVLGKQNVINILMAAACAKELGMSLGEISDSCRKITQEMGGMRVLQKNGKTIIDSSYSSNLDGVIADLDYLKLYPQKKVVIMPCLIELNGVAKKVHWDIGEKIAEVADLAIITTKDYYEDIKDGAKEKTLLIEKPEEIIEKIKEIGECVILLEGRVPQINFK
jgi:UDP-N-acetylmuramoyl-tripeptide--D-alanyl-D-alanine ligase